MLSRIEKLKGSNLLNPFLKHPTLATPCVPPLAPPPAWGASRVFEARMNQIAALN